MRHKISAFRSLLEMMPEMKDLKEKVGSFYINEELSNEMRKGISESSIYNMVQNLNKIKIEHSKEEPIFKIGVFLEGKQEGVHQYIAKKPKTMYYTMKYYSKGKMIFKR